VADRIAAVVETAHPKLRYVVGSDALIALILRALLPWRLFEWLTVKSSGIDA
jgi:hypothetical protein